MSLQDDRDRLDKIRKQVETSMTDLTALLGVASVGGDSPPAVGPSLAKHVHYRIFRDYIEHEDGLINNRLLWIINIQGFLFATYGFSVQKLAEIQSYPKGDRPMGGSGVVALDWLIISLPILGVVISIFSLIGVIAAQNAIAQLARDWQAAEAEYQPGASPRSGGPLLPGITGGGDGLRREETSTEPNPNPRAHTLGFLGPIAFPWLFVAVWLFLLVTYLWFPNHMWPGRL